MNRILLYVRCKNVEKWKLAFDVHVHMYYCTSTHMKYSSGVEEGRTGVGNNYALMRGVGARIIMTPNHYVGVL
jgi:hypothetical protein